MSRRDLVSGAENGMSCNASPSGSSGRAWLVAVVLVLGGRAAAEEPPAIALPGESRATASRLAEAQKRIAERKWTEALEELQGVLDGGGNDLVPINPHRSVQARRVVHAAIAGLPAEALALYRSRVEGQAARWLQQGVAARDPRLLRKVVEEAFCSRAAEKALDLLGDLAFERGRFEEAAGWWRLLAAPRGEPTELVYPDLRLDRARVLAKQVLARLFGDGPREAWADLLRAYRAEHGAAEGVLAGRRGRLADILEAVAAERSHEPLPDPDWSTYGGNDARGGVMPAPADVLDHLGALCRDGPTWRFSLQGRGRAGGAAPVPERTPTLTTLARTLAFHPVLTATHVLVADAGHVTAHDLRSGSSKDWYELPAGEAAGLNLQLPAPPDLSYTLTASGGNVFARLGAQGLLPPPAPAAAGPRPLRNAPAQESFVACLGQEPQGEDRLRWRLAARGGAGTFFEGSPVVDGEQVFVAVTRFAERRAVTSLACYGRGAPEPALRWRRELCEARTVQVGRNPRGEAEEARFRHHLLTRAGSLLVYCSHSGAIVAVDAATGQLAWGVRYRRPLEDSDDNTLDIVPTMQAAEGWREANPCLYAGGRLYAAPADSNRLLCLDPASGKTLWERERLRVIHLLGVGHGKLIFTTAHGLRAVGAEDGGDATGWPHAAVAGPLAPMGRGLLLGDLVLWPTALRLEEGAEPHFAVFAIRQEDGQPAAEPARLHRLPAGNLAYAHGCLAVADPYTLSVFVPPRLRPGEKEAGARDLPAGPMTRQALRSLLDLARADTEAGRPDAALTILERAQEGAGSLSSGGERLRQEALALHVDALVRQADVEEKEGHPEKALTAWEQVLSVPPLRTVAGVNAAGLPCQARAGAAAAAGRLCRTHEVLARQTEERARQILASAPPGQREAVLDHLLAELPHARTTRAALREQALAYEAAKQPLAAAQAWRRLCICTAGDEDEAAARAALVRCLDSPSPPSEPLAGGNGPLLRRWHFALQKGQAVLAGLDTGQDPLVVIGREGGQLLALAAASGAVAWRTTVAFTPAWAATLGDLVLVAGAGGIACRRRDDGGAVWEFPAPPREHFTHTAPAVFRPVLDPDPPEPLEAFHLCGGRLFFLQGRRRLCALNVQTGELLWARWAPLAQLHLPAPRGTFCPAYLSRHQAVETVLAQTASGRRWLLDAASGRLIRDAAGSARPWSCPPLELGNGLLGVVEDLHRVVAVDAATGREAWHHVVSHPALSGLSSQLVADGKSLLIVTPTNLGCRLERLDPATGQSLWVDPLVPAPARFDTSGWAVDGESLYRVFPQPSASDAQPTGLLLECRSVQDGRVRWQRPLQGAPVWTVRRVREGLLCFPSPRPGPQFRFRWALGALQWVGEAGTGDPSASGRRGEYPIVWCDPQTGATVQRWSFQSMPRLHWSRSGWGSLEGGFCLAPLPPGSLREGGRVLRLGQRTAVVALAGDVWGLAAD
jgi:outer membrane protein assembly factor BamB